jgi:AcrR family transcriptional regulator
MEDEFVKILEKTRELSNSYSIRRLSLEEICQKIGISKSTLHKYVKNKTQLVEEALKYERQQFEDIFLTNDFENTNAIDILFAVSLEVCHRFNIVSPSVTFDLAKYYPDVYRKHIDSRTEYIFEKIKINIEKGIRQGMYRSDFSIELIARLYISRLLDIHNPEFFPREKYSFSMLFEVMFENFVRSIGTLEGIAYFEERKASIKFEI